MEYELKDFTFPGPCAVLMHKRDILSFDLAGHRFFRGAPDEDLVRILNNANDALSMLSDEHLSQFFLLMQRAKAIIDPRLNFCETFHRNDYAIDLTSWFKFTDILLTIIRGCEVITNENSKVDPVFNNFFAPQIVAMSVASQILMPLTSEFELHHQGTSRASKSGMVIKYISEWIVPMAWKYLKQMIEEMATEVAKTHLKDNQDIDKEFTEDIFRRYIAYSLFHLPFTCVENERAEKHFVVNSDNILVTMRLSISNLIKDKLTS